MASNEHHDPTVSNRRAVAPYNFVSLPAVTLPAPDLPDHDNYELNSGYFDCILETSSPTYIRGMQKIELFRRLEAKKNEMTVEDKMSRAAFYQVGEEAQIPGSSLRGLFRTLVEVITWSRPLAVSSNPLVYRSVDTTSNGIKYRNRLMEAIDERTFRPRIKAGYMRHRGGEWFIQPALEVKGITYARIPHEILFTVGKDLEIIKRNWENVRRIYVNVNAPDYLPVREFLSIWYAKVTDASARPKPGFVEAVVSRSGDIDSKKSEAVIFPPDPDKASPKDWIAVSDDLTYQYRENISKQLSQFIGNKGVLQDGYPVFYLMEGETLVAFGHCQMLRLPYLRAPHDLVPVEVRDLQQPDLAEAVFGYAGKSYAVGGSRAGRVSFSDARCLPGQENIFHSIIRPQVLSTPKPTSFQLYLTQDCPDDKRALQDYDSAESIRGTKFYWHKGECQLNQIEANDPRADHFEKQYTRIQPVRVGVSFKFRIYFHNLTDLELGMMGSALNIAANKSTRLKLGMGKPLGMGAVMLAKVEPRLIDRKRRYDSLFDSEEKKTWWEDGVEPQDTADEVMKNAREKYEQWILAQPAANPDKSRKFLELPRIRELLQILAWPGPTPPETYTRYLSFPKEFRERGVLPTPGGVARNLPEGSRYPEAKSRTGFNSAPQKAPRTPQLADPEIPAQTSARMEARYAEFLRITADRMESTPEKTPPKTGEIVIGKVLEDTSSGTLLAIHNQPDDILGWISNDHRGDRRFVEAQEIHCRVVSEGRRDGSDTIFDFIPVDSGQ